METRANSYENKGALDYGQNLKWDGNISAMSWKSSLDGKQRGYDYQYDPLSRLGNANYHGGNGNEKYSEGNLGYDENGNILNLERDGLTSVGNFGQVDKLAYSYKGNQLLSVTDAAAATGIAGDFQNGNKTGYDYEYDLNGNLTRDRNKKIASIKYNKMNLPEQIIWENGDKIEYLYDKAGIKLRSSVFQHTSGGAYSLVRETDYCGSFVYEKGILSFMHMAEGRYVFKLEDVPSGGRRQGYEYHLKDHLGNLRVAFRKGQDITYNATMELENTAEEAREFDNVVNVRSNPGQGRSSNFAARIDQSIPMGIWKTLKVGKGDRVDAEVWARYTQDNTQNNGSGLGIYATTLVPNPSGDPDRQTGNSAPLLALGMSYAPNQNPDNNSDVPRAYLIGILYDLEGNPVETHRVEITRNAKTDWEQLTKSITVSQAGQLQIFVANEGNIPVFFDDMEIKLSQNLIAQENHYYPFGMNLAGIEKEGRPDHRFQFQGQEKQTDFGLNWSHFKWRMADTQLGRFFAVDPLSEKYLYNSVYAFSENKVVRHVELEGLEAVESSWLKNAWDNTVNTVEGSTKAVLNYGGAVVSMFGNAGIFASNSVLKTNYKPWYLITTEGPKPWGSKEGRDILHTTMKTNGENILKLSEISLSFIGGGGIGIAKEATTTGFKSLFAKSWKEVGTNAGLETVLQIGSNAVTGGDFDYNDVLGAGVFKAAPSGLFNSVVDVDDNNGLSVYPFNKSGVGTVVDARVGAVTPILQNETKSEAVKAGIDGIMKMFNNVVKQKVEPPKEEE